MYKVYKRLSILTNYVVIFRCGKSCCVYFKKISSFWGPCLLKIRAEVLTTFFNVNEKNHRNLFRGWGWKTVDRKMFHNPFLPQPCAESHSLHGLKKIVIQEYTAPKKVCIKTVIQVNLILSKWKITKHITVLTLGSLFWFLML